jgi:hypothetical protein
MPTSMTKTPVMPAPMPTDRRVVAMGQAMGVTTRDAWAMAAEAWAWLQAEAGDDGVVPGAVALLDAVADVEGLGAALVAAGLVGATEQGILLPPELVRASRLLDGGGDVVVEDRRRKGARERQARCRKRRRLSGRSATKTAAPVPGAGQQPAPRHKPRKLGVACGHAVMLLEGPYGPYVSLERAKPKLTASMEAYDYDTITLADALEALVPWHAEHKAPDGGYRVPTLADLESAARAARDRQQAAGVAADRRDEGNAALLEAAAEDDDDIPERDGHAPVTPVTRDGRDRHVSCHAATSADTATKSTNGEDLRDASRHASCHASGGAAALSSSSSSSGSPHAQQETTTTKGPTEIEPEWLRRERQERQRARTLACANALGVTVPELKVMYESDADGLRRRLEAAGIDPVTGNLLRAQGRPGRSSVAATVAAAAGIPLPDLRVERLRAVASDECEILDEDDDRPIDHEITTDDTPGGHAHVA